MVEVSEVGRADGDHMVKFTFVGLQVFERSSGDKTSHRVAHKTHLVLLNVDRVEKILHLDGQSMRRLLYILLRPSLINAGK